MIGGLGKQDNSAQAVQGGQKPDASQLVSRLFAKLDASGLGSIDKAGLESAFSKLYSAGTTGPGATGGKNSAASADAVFKALDANGDGKLTKQEATDSLSNILTQIEKSGAPGAGGVHKGHHHKHQMQGAGDASGPAAADAGAGASAAAAPSGGVILHRMAQLMRAYADPVGTVASTVASKVSLLA
jgi:hypothetical protein